MKMVMSGMRWKGQLSRPADSLQLYGFESRNRLERYQYSAEFHGREVARFLRQAKFGKTKHQTSQLIRKAREHARLAWGAAVRAESAELVESGAHS